MNTQENILELWMGGELDDAQVIATYPDLDLIQLRTLLKHQAQLDLELTPHSEIWERIQEKTIRPEEVINSKRKVSTLLYIVSALLLIALSVLYWQNNRSTRLETLKSTQQFILADNTQIELSPSSTIDYLQSTYSENRLLQLKGQAFFNVKQPGSFSVETEAGTVEVLGTQFDVHAFNKEYMTVTCFEGRVQIKNKGGEKTILAAGQSTELINQAFTQTETHQLSRSSWMDQEQIYKSALLNIVHHDLERFYNVKIETEIDIFSSFTGRIPLNNLEKALLYLSSATGTQYVYNKESNTIQIR